MKSANWISATGRRPLTAAPIEAPDDHRFGQRRVDHAIVAELGPQAVRGQEDAALLADVLAEHDDRLVAAHLVGQRLADGVDERARRHQSGSSA